MIVLYETAKKEKNIYKRIFVLILIWGLTVLSGIAKTYTVGECYKIRNRHTKRIVKKKRWRGDRVRIYVKSSRTKKKKNDVIYLRFVEWRSWVAEFCLIKRIVNLVMSPCRRILLLARRRHKSQTDVLPTQWIHPHLISQQFFLFLFFYYY